MDFIRAQLVLARIACQNKIVAFTLDVFLPIVVRDLPAA